LPGRYLSGIVRELITLVNYAHVVSGIGSGVRGRGLDAPFSPEPHRAKSVFVARSIPVTAHTGQMVMTAIHETAYPRIRSNLSDKELEKIYM
jgi:hypothetical protein